MAPPAGLSHRLVADPGRLDGCRVQVLAVKRPDIAALLEPQQTSASAATPPWPCDMKARRSLHGEWHSTWPTGPAPLDANLLLATGAMTGPHRRTRPVLFGPVRRFVRALLDAIFSPNNRSPR